MPANGFAAAVADADVDMGTIDRNCTGKAYNFKMAAAGAAVGLIGKTDIVIRQTAHAGIDPTGFNLFFSNKFLNFLF